MTRAARVWLLTCLLVLSGTLPVAAQTTGPDARIESVTYSGDGLVSGTDSTLWRSASHQFAVTVSTNSDVDGELCLRADPAGSAAERQVTCVSTTLAANTTSTVTIPVAEWPANLAGSQVIRVSLQTSESSSGSTGGSLSVTVIRRGADLDGDGLTNEREAAVGSNLRVGDSDGDGLSDDTEVQTYGTSPTTRDSDGDGLSDPAEVNVYQTNPTNADSDGDGLPDDRELSVGTNPNQADSDGDGVSDTLEVNTYDTNPTDPDSDDDGLDDYAEIEVQQTNPTRSDTDDDGLNDNLEINTYGTDPNKVDSDGDGLIDGREVTDYQSDPATADSDGDGLSDGPEVNTFDTNPTNPDTDGDGLTDGAEVNRYGTNPNEVDTDNDGSSDYMEVGGAGFGPLGSRTAQTIALAVAVLVGIGVFYRSGHVSAQSVHRIRESLRMRYVSETPEDSSPDEQAGPQTEADEIPPEFLSNEQRILRLLEENEGRMRQTAIVDETGWSKSKVSRVLGEMESEEQVVKVDVGKGNVVTRPEDLPSGAKSPFDSS